MEKRSPATQTRLAKALSHPLRQRLLIGYTDRTASPAELADELEAPLTSVSYHTQRLLRHGLIELVGTERRRGGLTHLYRAVAPPQLEDESWGALSPALRRSLAGDLVGRVWDELREALGRGAFEDAEVHVSRTPLELDDEAHAELSALLRRLVVDEAPRLQRETAERGAAARRSSTLAILHFDQPHRLGTPGAAS
jgi:DNA-binding transcriptional ArsR family regulator